MMSETTLPLLIISTYQIVRKPNDLPTQRVFQPNLNVDHG